MFKHALVQDAAYGTLLREPAPAAPRRASLRALEEHFPEVAEAQPELLAHHCAEAGLAGRRSPTGIGPAAGHRALGDVEAIAHLHAAWELLDGPARLAQRGRAELELQTALGGP